MKTNSLIIPIFNPFCCHFLCIICEYLSSHFVSFHYPIRFLNLFGLLLMNMLAKYLQCEFHILISHFPKLCRFEIQMESIGDILLQQILRRMSVPNWTTCISDESFREETHVQCKEIIFLSSNLQQPLRRCSKVVNVSLEVLPKKVVREA
jgi:hypothetical protein